MRAPVGLSDRNWDLVRRLTPNSVAVELSARGRSRIYADELNRLLDAAREEGRNEKEGAHAR
jgi:hypothetical protein